MKKILITFGTRPLAQRIAKKLDAEFEVLFASSEELPSVLVSSQKYVPIPVGILPTFAHEVLKVALDRGIDYVLPLGMFEINTLAEAKILFQEYGIAILGPTKNQLTELNFVENPPADFPLLLSWEGQNLIDNTPLNIVVDGCVSMSDSGEDALLCVVSKS